MSGFEKQTYTQVPNSLFKVMKDMDECELKVVMLICRLTFGYHRDDIQISTRNISKEIGMSTASVDKGADAAVARGLIERVTDGQKTTAWRAIVSDLDSDTEVVQNLIHPVSEVDAQLRVKERVKKVLKKKKGASAQPPEIVLFKEVVRHYPKANQRETVIDAIQKVNSRLGRFATFEDLKPWFTEWGKYSGNEWSLVWLDWAIAGKTDRAKTNGKSYDYFAEYARENGA